MTTFDKREKAEEAKFATDQAFQFKVYARRNKLLGLWAAEIMGISGADAEAYAKEVIKADFEEAGDDDVLRKVSGDFATKGVDRTDAQIRKHMDELLIVAKEQLEAEA